MSVFKVSQSIKKLGNSAYLSSRAIKRYGGSGNVLRNSTNSIAVKGMASRLYGQQLGKNGAYLGKRAQKAAAAMNKMGIADPNFVEDKLTRKAILAGRADPSFAAAQGMMGMAKASWKKVNYVDAAANVLGAGARWGAGYGLTGSRRIATVGARAAVAGFALGGVNRLRTGSGDPLTYNGRFDIAGLPFI